MYKKIIAMSLGISMMISCTVLAAGTDQLIELVPAPSSGSIGGEWTVIALARSGAEVPDGYYEGYLDSVEQRLEETNGVLDDRKYTEYSRVSLGLAALGENPQDFRGWNVLDALKDVEQVKVQGTNGPIWALIAADSYDYEDMDETIDLLLEEVLELQNEDGGYGYMTGQPSDPDMSAMALTALSAHQDDPKAAEAVEQGLIFLDQARENGFSSSESFSQALLAYSSLNCQEEAEICREALEEYAIEGGYRHSMDEKEVNGMATEQAMYSIAAFDRMENGENRLFDMRDVL